ncbi:MAG: glycoside hydrolase family 19 protein [Pikeienuella sp.]
MDKKRFYAALRGRHSGVFGTSLSQSQVDGIEGILRAFQEVGDGEGDTLAYALATAYHETGRKMVPVREGFARTDKGARQAVNKLARKRGPNSAVAKYAKPQPPYGHVYYGRGHVQLTWLDNYRRSSRDAGTDLVKNPDAMLDPRTSARVLFKGLLDGRWNGKGKGLRFYLDRGDLKSARRTVNVLDKWSQIASYHKAFLRAIETAGGWQQPKEPKPPLDHVPAKPPAKKGWLAKLIEALLGK